MNNEEVTVEQAFSLCTDDEHVILDVRTPTECSQGICNGAKILSLHDIQQNNLSTLSSDRHYYLICKTGKRSKLALTILRSKGFRHLFHISHGYDHWLKKNLPIEIPVINKNDVRYSRHYQLSKFGRTAQEKLQKSHVLVIGAGGLGSPCLIYLAASGIGHLTLIDDDCVELSNLHRQVLHNDADIGVAKVTSAQSKLSSINPEINIRAMNARLDVNNINDILEGIDVVIDGSDNMKTRYLVNDYCYEHKKKLVYASVYQYESQLTVFDFTQNYSACLRCLFPEVKGFEPENCSTAGVLSTVPGVAGVMQANEAIKLITGIGQPLINELLIIDVLNNDFRKIKFKKSTSCLLHT